ncbi:hypothetical protein [Kribbella sp. DT2]
MILLQLVRDTLGILAFIAILTPTSPPEEPPRPIIEFHTRGAHS